MLHWPFRLRQQFPILLQAVHAAIDKEKGTVIMIQIENEIGMLEDARDYSQEADKAFRAPVPTELMN